MRLLSTGDITSDRLAALDGLVSSDVGERLYELAAGVAEEFAIVEIGSFRGKSTCYLAAGAREGNGAHVWAIDAWDLPGNQPGRHRYDTAHAEFDRQVRAMDLGEHITPIQGFSSDVAKAWKGDIGLLFIDGSHEYPDVRADWIAWSRYLATGALVVFDDYATTRNPGVTRLVDELAESFEIGGLDTACPPLAVAVATE
jgi:MMP 1-O-methyltransferase